MDETPEWVGSAALAFAAISTLAVVAISVRLRFHPPKPKRPKRVSRGTIEMVCSVCRRRLVFQRSELVPLSPAEVALTVRSNRALYGRRLMEYVCPYCEAAHCFSTDERDPVWLGVNLYTPQARTNHCAECRRPLRRPPWRPGVYDGRLAAAPHIPPDVGLVCSKCGAVCCVACCRDVTRKRTKDGSLLCPRCGRGPLETVYHF